MASLTASGRLISKLGEKGKIMSLDIVRGHISNLVVMQPLINVLKAREQEDIQETLYIGYPLAPSYDGTVILDALLVSERYGAVAFIFANSNDDARKVLETQGEIYFKLTNTLTQYPKLRKGRGLAFDPCAISIVAEEPDPNEIEDEYIISTIGGLNDEINGLPQFDKNFYPALVESIQRISTIKPKKKRANVKEQGSKGGIIKKIEAEIANLDRWQNNAAFEVADSPQRIRGLAGSGKTIVLAMKAAYLHIQHPEWNIVVTFYTRSLYQQYRNLITKFVYEFSKDEPDWAKLNLLHAWGSQSAPGLYSEIAHSINVLPLNLVNAQNKYGENNMFTGICNELNGVFPDENKEQYDLILIDEAQDLPASFFRLAYKAAFPPKRIVWAYDELQNLGSAAMPSIEDMFGTKDGQPIVELKNEPNAPSKDIVLPVCYRNPPWVLSLAHSLGFGIYRNKLVQHFDELSIWDDIGYKIDSGSLSYGSTVALSRKSGAAPEYFFDLLRPDDVLKWETFENSDDQYRWIAQAIKSNIENDELDPDDILVIFPSAISARKQYHYFAQHLYNYGIQSIMAGVTNSRDTFKTDGYVSCSTIYRAKGNEAPMVYITNADYCNGGLELIKLRNTLFTAATRSRAWVRICGVGDEMTALSREIQAFVDKNYTLSFRIPTKDEMAQMRTIHKDRSAVDAKKIEEAKKGLKLLHDLLKKGEIDASQVPELVSLQTLLEQGNAVGGLYGED